MRTLRAVVLILVLLAVLPACAAASRLGSARSSRPVTLHLHELRVAAGFEPGGQLAVNDRYVVLVTGPPQSPRVELIDRRSRHGHGLARTRLSPPGCAAPGLPMLGGPWLALVCPSVPYSATAPYFTELYRLSSKQWIKVPWPAAFCSASFTSCDPASAVGTHWLKIPYHPHCSSGGYHCLTLFAIQNVDTGAVKNGQDETGDRLYDNLNAPSGVGTLCPPLRYPSEGASSAVPAFNLSVLGSFALVEFDESNYNFDLSDPLYRLYACHSHLDLAIPIGPAFGDDRAVIWQGATGPLYHYGETSDPSLLRGVLLPSLQRFTVRERRWPVSATPGEPTPGGTVLAYERPVALAGRTIYFQGGDTLWAADLPSRVTGH
jgi:hypothetical protein